MTTLNEEPEAHADEEAVRAAYHRQSEAQDRSHPFLGGIHTPLKEEFSLEDLPVTGRIPDALHGRYLRMGPNPARPDPRGYHWFGGDGMVHGLRLQGGRALWYRNRWIRSNALEEATGRPAAPGPRHGAADTVNTAIVNHAGVVLATVEAGSTPVSLDESLDVEVYYDFKGTLDGSYAPHPHRDPQTGELHAITYLATEPDHVRHVVVGPDGLVQRELKIPLPHGPSVHDMAITERFAIVLDLPVTFSQIAVEVDHSFPYRWNDAQQARVGLLPRRGGADDIVWIDIDPCWLFHTVNAYDLPDGRVVLDAIVYDEMFTGVPDGPTSNPRGLQRWTIDPVARTVEMETLDATPQEFPRIDERVTGRRHRFAYSLSLPQPYRPEFVGSGVILKNDLEAGILLRRDFGNGKIAGEFAFIARAPDAAEDEGWLIGFVVDPDAGATDLVILDAQDFEGPAVASVRVPHAIPAGFHGGWIATPHAG